ncbi:MAG: potassium transporter TrkA, partial [Chloroflexi bacterium]|nr:potassium transporter TrkA [Chloroflexota bacterium]
NQLDLYVAPGSEVMIVAESDQVEPTLAADCTDLKNLRVIFQPGSTTNRRILDSLNVQDYDHIITLSYMDDLPAQEADASTLVTLLHLRDIGEKMGRSFSIVSEMLDVRNRELAEVTRADDFIVSDRLISLMLSQVSENRELMDVLLDLFDPDGAELYLKPAKEYVQLGQPVNFYTVIEAACGRDEIAIGYRLQRESGSVEASYGVHLNPEKSQMVTFAEEDKLVVLSES